MIYPERNAILFDGISSRLRPITLAVSETNLQVTQENRSDEYPLEQIRTVDGLGASSVVIYLPNGARIEVPGVRTGAELGLARRSRIRWLECGVKGLIISVALIVFGIWGTGRWFLPPVAALLANRIPDEVFTQLDRATIDALNDALTEPSKLPQEEQERLRENFLSIMRQANVPDHIEILFLSTKQPLVNAFTLPGDHIVVTDDLVKLVKDPELISAVLAHELGHHHLRHARTAFAELSLGSVLIGMITGDFSNTIGQASLIAWRMQHSRRDELAADKWGAELLKSAGLDPNKLGESLKMIDTEMAARTQKCDAEETSAFSFPSWLNSHPETEERIERIRKISGVARQ